MRAVSVLEVCVKSPSWNGISER